MASGSMGVAFGCDRRRLDPFLGQARHASVEQGDDHPGRQSLTNEPVGVGFIVANSPPSSSRRANVREGPDDFVQVAAHHDLVIFEVAEPGIVFANRLREQGIQVGKRNRSRGGAKFFDRLIGGGGKTRGVERWPLWISLSGRVRLGLRNDAPRWSDLLARTSGRRRWHRTRKVALDGPSWPLPHSPRYVFPTGNVIGRGLAGSSAKTGPTGDFCGLPIKNH